MAFGPLKTKKIESKAASKHLAASKPNCAKPMCRQSLATEGSRERQFALSCPPRSHGRNHLNPAHLSDILFSFHFEFFGSPATLENLKWHRAVPGQRPTTRFGRSMFWLGIKARWKRSTTAGSTIFRQS